MNNLSLYMIVAPLSLFIIGVLIIPYLTKPRKLDAKDSFKLIDEFEKKYIY